MNTDRLHLPRRARATAVTADGTDATAYRGADATGYPATDSDLFRDRAADGSVDTRPVDTTRPVDPAVDPALDESVLIDRRVVLQREKEAFGGVKAGSAFFGWLTATGTAVLLTALLTAGGTAVGVLNGSSVSRPDFGVTWTGVRGAVAILAVLFVAYFCGGYVAGRMARFNGIRQGLAVWLWALVAAIVVAALGAVVGTQWNALVAVTGIPRFSTGPSAVTSDGVLIGLLAAAAALVGSLVGGLAGMSFHRRVDRAGLAGPLTRVR